MNLWTTGEVAAKRNISVRTLRYYDQINLLTPSSKDANGKRYYSREDLDKLEKIIILKSLSLPLEEIREALDKLSYKQILTTHYNYLQDQLDKLQINISNTTSLINMINVETSIPWDYVADVIKTPQNNSKKWIDYFHDEERELLHHSIPILDNNDKTITQYISLLNRMEQCIQNNQEPESAEGRRIGEELIAIGEKTFHGNTDLMDRFWEIRLLPSEETGLYPISGRILEFADRCYKYAADLQGK